MSAMKKNHDTPNISHMRSKRNLQEVAFGERKPSTEEWTGLEWFQLSCDLIEHDITFHLENDTYLCQI